MGIEEDDVAAVGVERRERVVEPALRDLLQLGVEREPDVVARHRDGREADLAQFAAVVPEEPDAEPLEPVTFDAAPPTFSLRTGAFSLATLAACCAVCCTFGLLFTRSATWRICS